MCFYFVAWFITSDASANAPHCFERMTQNQLATESKRIGRFITFNVYHFACLSYISFRDANLYARRSKFEWKKTCTNRNVESGKMEWGKTTTSTAKEVIMKMEKRICRIKWNDRNEIAVRSFFFFLLEFVEMLSEWRSSSKGNRKQKKQVKNKFSSGWNEIGYKNEWAAFVSVRLTNLQFTCFSVSFSLSFSSADDDAALFTEKCQQMISSVRRLSFGSLSLFWRSSVEWAWVVIQWASVAHYLATEKKRV